MLLSNNEKKRSKDQGSHQELTIIGKDCLIKGDLSSDKPVRLDGKVIGLVKVEESLIVGSEGVIEGDVAAKHVIIFGKVAGNITSEKLEIRAEGKVLGNIDSKLIEMEAGAHYVGEMKIGASEDVSEPGVISLNK
ncbi:bactofilin family protein [Olivibacter sitiensis]|uniref:bactofilin family protein n=1 Tax=Olivibacter sitiensis TaxID=376470 RepID=UPI0004246226|nr:polymer-forming cytoskeletal protein [Olivibacter sitiensis]